MTFRITKKAIRSLLDEYIGDADKPTQQPEPRLGDFFDKTSIIDEIFLNVENNINGIKSDEDLRRIVRLIVHMAEENANKYKRFKVISEDVAFACSQINEIANKA